MANDLLDNSMKETELGSLPADWSVVAIGDLATQVGSGVTPRGGRESYLKDGVPLVRSQNVLMNRLDLSDVAYIGEDVHESMSRSSLHPSDLLLNITGASIGRVAVVPKSLKKANVNQHVCIIRLNGLCNPWFASFYLSTAMGQSQVLGSQYGTTRQGLNFGQVRQLRLPIPPLEEQQAIAHVLRTVQRAKEATDKVIAAARQLKQSLMRHLFTYGPVSVEQADKVSLKETEIGAIPEHWNAERLLTLLREPLRNGHSARATNTDVGIRTLTLTAVTKNDFSVGNTKLTTADAGKVRGMWLKSGDIYVERANTPEYVGLAALYEGPDDFAIYPDLMIRVRVTTDAIVPKFLAEFMLTGICRRYFQSNAKATAGNFPKIDQGVIEATMVPLPPMDEQNEIAKSLMIIDRKINAETIRRNALEAMFRTLLHDLMTGKVRVNELEFPAMKEGSP